jgi:hypothetical protein
MNIIKLMFLPVYLFLIITSICGLVYAFKASIIFGIITLFVQPAPFVLGLLGWFGHSDVSQIIAHWLHLI